MKLIVTAGGTSERIDEVRVISNFSTGKLGLAMAETFLKNSVSHEDKMYYLCDKNTIAPQDDKIQVVRVQGVAGLMEGLEAILTREKIDAVIHAMAVSDYCVSQVTTLETLKENNFESQENACTCGEQSVLQGKSSGKISSEIDDLVLVLKRTPKVIGEIKKMQQGTILVGFKLLTKVEKEVLLDTALKLLRKNDCDMVLANDLSEIKGNQHKGYLVMPDGEAEVFETKAEIAQGIFKEIGRLIAEKSKAMGESEKADKENEGGAI